MGNLRQAFNEPFFLQWHLTDRCNLSCRHCYRDEKKTDLDIIILQEILDEYVRFLQTIGRKGRIQFSGGEPFLSSHLFNLIHFAKEKHLPTRILSNGTLVTRAVAEQTYQAGCRLVQVSIDGLEDTHDRLQGQRLQIHRNLTRQGHLG